MGRKATRLKEFEEGVRTIREVLQGGELVTPNSRVRVNYRLLPTPVYLSMEGPKGLRLAGRVADGVFLGSGVEPRAVSWALARIAEGAAEAGRAPDEIAALAAGMVCIKEDGDEARQIVRRASPIGRTTTSRSRWRPCPRKSWRASRSSWRPSTSPSPWRSAPTRH